MAIHERDSVKTNRRSSRMVHRLGCAAGLLAAEYFNQFKVSPLGKTLAEGKFVRNSVDHSDSATYGMLLGNWGVRLKDLASNGTDSAEVERSNEKKFQAHSRLIQDELLRRARAAAGLTPSEN